MKKPYQIFVIGAIILLGGVAFYLAYKKVIGSWREKKEAQSQEALSVDLETDISKRASYIIAQKKASLLRHYDENSELVWIEEGVEKSYRGVKEIQDFWDGFFQGASIASSDSSNFQMAGNKSQIDLTLVIWRNGIRTTVKKFYRLELGENGKIRKEIFSDQGEDLVSSGDQKEGTSAEVFKVGIIKEISQAENKVVLDVNGEENKVSREEFAITPDTKVLDGQDDSKEVGLGRLSVETRVGIVVDQKSNQVKSFIIENKL